MGLCRGANGFAPAAGIQTLSGPTGWLRRRESVTEGPRRANPYDYSRDQRQRRVEWGAQVTERRRPGSAQAAGPSPCDRQTAAMWHSSAMLSACILSMTWAR